MLATKHCLGIAKITNLKTLQRNYVQTSDMQTESMIQKWLSQLHVCFLHFKAKPSSHQGKITQGKILSPLITSYVTLGKAVNFSVSEFFKINNEDNNTMQYYQNYKPYVKVSATQQAFPFHSVNYNESGHLCSKKADVLIIKR